MFKQIIVLSILVQAEEKSPSKRFATAKLNVVVRPVDSNPPQITASATEGVVDENVPPGTRVLDDEGNSIHLTVSDTDLVSANC